MIVGLLPAFGVVARSRAENLGAVSSERAGSRMSVIVRKGLVVTEVSMSVLLLVVASLLGRSFVNLTAVDTGFDQDNTIAASLDLPGTWGAVEPAGVQLVRDFGNALERLPEIEGVTLASGIPPSVGFWTRVELETEANQSITPERPAYLPYASIRPEYWDILGARPGCRQEFHGTGTFDDNVTIIDETLARALWGDANPVGKRFRVNSDSDWITVVGVVNDIKMTGFAEEYSLGYDMFYPLNADNPPKFSSFLVRFNGDAAVAMESMRRELRALDPHLPLLNLGLLRDRMVDNVTDRRFNANMMSAFAVVGLILAIVGVYGVLAFSVRQRRREIGIRMALGATGNRIVRSVVREGVVLTLAGVMVGLIGLAAVGRLFSALLFEVEVYDPAAIGAVAVAMGAAAFFASLIPSRRAGSSRPG